MFITRSVIWMVAVTAISLSTSTVSGQSYPNKPMRVVTGEAGGGNDVVSRLIGQGISGPLGQPVITDNRRTSSRYEIVARASPDGYTLLLNGAPFWLAPLLQKMSYDPIRDFSPITLAIQTAQHDSCAPVVAGQVRQGVDRFGQSQAGRA